VVGRAARLGAVGLAIISLVGCSFHHRSDSPRPSWTPITTTYASLPTSGCSLDAVRRAFRERGVRLIVTSPEVTPDDPLLGILGPQVERDPRAMVEVTVFRNAKLAARYAASGKPGAKNRLRMVYAMNIIVVYRRSAPQRLRDAIEAVVVRRGCLRR
jgi:outer membrane lipopolysaccharide assembly protein LptE/RlpB